MSTYEVLRKLQCHRLFCTNVLGSGHLTKCSVTYKLLQKIRYSWAAYKCRFFCGGIINIGRIQSVNTKASNVPKSHQWCHLKWRWIRSAHRPPLHFLVRFLKLTFLWQLSLSFLPRMDVAAVCFGWHVVNSVLTFTHCCLCIVDVFCKFGLKSCLLSPPCHSYEPSSDNGSTAWSNLILCM